MLLWFLAAPSGQASSSPAGFEAEPYGTKTGPQTEMKTHISKARGHFSKEAQANPRQAPLRTQKHHGRLTRGETRGMEM